MEVNHGVALTLLPGVVVVVVPLLLLILMIRGIMDTLPIRPIRVVGRTILPIRPRTFIVPIPFMDIPVCIRPTHRHHIIIIIPTHLPVVLEEEDIPIRMMKMNEKDTIRMVEIRKDE